jgi:hypothetical protein
LRCATRDRRDCSPVAAFLRLMNRNLDLQPPAPLCWFLSIQNYTMRRERTT